MSEIATSRIESFLRRPDPRVRAVLVFGPDSGKVRERAALLAASVCPDPADPFRVVELAPRTLIEDPGRLHDEAAALAFGGGRRVVRVRGAGDSQADAFVGFLAAPSGDALIVVEAGDLGRSSRLRAVFKGAAEGVSIACYGDAGEGLDGLIDSVLAGHAVDPAARGALVRSLGADRLLSRRELEKLALYLDADEPVSVAAVQAVVGDAAGLGLDDIAFAVAEGRLADVDGALARAWRAGNNAVAVVRGVMRHLQRLHRVVVAGGGRAAGIDSAVAALRPPLPPRLRGRIAQQAGRWPAARLETALRFLLEAEMDCKTTGYPDRAIVGRTLLRIAGAVRRP